MDNGEGRMLSPPSKQSEHEGFMHDQATMYGVSCQILGMKIIIICYIIPNMSIAPAVGCINFVQHCTGHSRGGCMELYVINDDHERGIYQANSIHM